MRPVREMDQAGTRLEPDCDKMGTRLGPDWDQTGTRLGPDWDQTGTRGSREQTDGSKLVKQYRDKQEERNYRRVCKTSGAAKLLGHGFL